MRQLERELGAVARKVARKIAAGEVEPPDDRRRRACASCSAGRRSTPSAPAREDQVGVATGMYYTPAGGDIMFVEAVDHDSGKGELGRSPASSAT